VPAAADAVEPLIQDVPVAAQAVEPLVPVAAQAVEPLVPVTADAVEPLAPAAAATAEPIAELAAEPEAADSEANDNLPMMLVAQAGTATETDAIARQVDQDLDDLADPVPDETIADVPAAPQPVMATAVQAQIAKTAEPANTPIAPSPQQARVSAAVAGAQAARAQLSDTLAAIESELFGSTRPDAGTDSAPSTAIPATPAKSAASPVAGPLASLMAMSEEERIALFS
jgi:hypothetical protein